jgi:hypothetical protein
MTLNAKITMSIRKFFKKYGKALVILIVVWLIVILVNNYLKTLKTEVGLQTTYSPDTPVISKGGTVPKQYREKISTLIDNYFEDMNSKNYQAAFDMLTDDCKQFLYNDSVDVFKDYVESVFNTGKIYNIQNYSNANNNYIYNINILDDIEATGTTTGYDVYTEKLIIKKDGDNFKISNQGYIGKTTFENIYAEDDQIKVKVNYKDASYKKEGYNLTIQNKTDKYIVIADNSISKEVELNIGQEDRSASNLTNANMILEPNSTKDFTVMFTKYYDDSNNANTIKLNSVRVLDKLDLNSTNTTKDAIKLYSFNISLKK